MQVPSIPGAAELAPAFPPPLSDDELELALTHPLESPRLSEVAAGKQRAVIIIEDASRPAKTAGLVRLILSELAQAKPPPRRLEVIFANGAHLGLDELNRQHKLPSGLDLSILQHDARREAIFVGRAPHGSPLRIDPAVAEADFRLGLGTVNLHPAAGFSGGAKLLLPGVAGLDSIMANHRLPPGKRGLEGSAWREEMEAVAALLPLHFHLAMLARPDGGIAGLWAGDPEACERAARQALLSYASLPKPPPAAFCLVGMAPFDRTLLGFFKAADLCLDLLSPGGTGVVAGACPDGPGEHLWRWHPETIARTNLRLREQWRERRLCAFAPGVSAADIRRLVPADVEHLADPQALESLAASLAGPKYVVPYGPMTAFE